MMKGTLKSKLKNSDVSGANYQTLTNLPQINGVTLIGNKTSSLLGLAPENVANACIVSVKLSREDNTLYLNYSLKNGITGEIPVELPKDIYTKSEVDIENQKIILTKKDDTTDELSLKEIFDKYVLKTTTIAGIDLQDDITARELEDAIKDQETILTNKTISADENTIKELRVDNFKEGVIVEAIQEEATDTSLPTEKAVKDYIEDKAVFTGNLTKEDTSIKLQLLNNKSDIKYEGQVDKVVFEEDKQTLTNKTIDTAQNTLLLQTNKDELKNNSFLAIDSDNKLYVKNSAGELICLNDNVLLNDLIVPKQLSNHQTKTSEDILTELKEEDILIKLKHPVQVMTYAEYEAIEKDSNTLYIITDYPSEDITETREMVNNRWVISYQDTTTPLLTFIYNNIPHNKKVYYTKEEVNKLLEYKEDIVNGAGQNITHDFLSSDKILITDGVGKIKASAYPTEALESIGLVMTPRAIIGDEADAYISLVDIRGYVVNKSNKVYRLDLTLNIDNVCPTWTKGGIMSIIMPDDYLLNYSSTYQSGFGAVACRCNGANDYAFDNMLFRYVKNNQIQVILGNSTLFNKVGRVNVSVSIA